MELEIGCMKSWLENAVRNGGVEILSDRQVDDVMVHTLDDQWYN